MFTAQDNTKLREHLKGYPVMAIAGQSGLSVQTVARFMDGSEGYENNDRMFLSLLYALKRLQAGLHPLCACAGCQGVRQFANGLGEMPMNLQILCEAYRTYDQKFLESLSTSFAIIAPAPVTPRAMPLRTRRMDITGVLFLIGLMIACIGAGIAYFSGKLGSIIVAMGLTCLVASFGIWLTDQKAHQV